MAERYHARRSSAGTPVSSSEGYVRVHPEGFADIVRSQGRVPSSEFLPPVLDEGVRASEVGEVAAFLATFQAPLQYVYERYTARASCNDMSALVVIVAQSVGIDARMVTNGTRSHTYAVLAVRSPDNGGTQEYRLDLTASQYATDGRDLGLVVTPRLRRLPAQASHREAWSALTREYTGERISDFFPAPPYTLVPDHLRRVYLMAMGREVSE